MLLLETEWLLVYTDMSLRQNVVECHCIVRLLYCMDIFVIISLIQLKINRRGAKYLVECSLVNPSTAVGAHDILVKGAYIVIIHI